MKTLFLFDSNINLSKYTFQFIIFYVLRFYLFHFTEFCFFIFNFRSVSNFMYIYGNKYFGQPNIQNHVTLRFSTVQFE